MREITRSVKVALKCLIEHLLAFAAIVSNICTAHAQCKFRLRRSISLPGFPVRVQNFGNLATSSVDFCIVYAECPPIFTSGLFDLLTEKVYHTRRPPRD